MPDFSIGDYVEVPIRIRNWYVTHPEGRIVADPPHVVELDGRLFIASTVRVYQDPNDPCPSQGSAWEPYPGRTPYTKDSEAMNAETSAVGRALALAGVATKAGISSAEEIRNRQAVPELAPPAAIQAVKKRCAELPDLLREQAADHVRRGPRIESMTAEEVADLHVWLDQLEEEPASEPVGD